MTVLTYTTTVRVDFFSNIYIQKMQEYIASELYS